MKTITIEEYLMGRVEFTTLLSAQQTNIIQLLQRVNNLLAEFGEYRAVSSGYRTMEDHLRIYKEINEKKKAKGLPEVKIPMGSKHLVGAACDLVDKDDRLKKFCTEAILKKYDLYMEHGDYTDTWCHLQTTKTSQRIFKPY